MQRMTRHQTQTSRDLDGAARRSALLGLLLM
jgi:hypothetical protein